MRAVLPQTMERLFSHQTSGSKGKGMESTRNLAEELHSTCGQRCKATAVESSAINTKSPTTFFHQCLPSHPASAARLTLLFLPSPLHFLLRNHHHHHHHHHHSSTILYHTLYPVKTQSLLLPLFYPTTFLSCIRQQQGGSQCLQVAPLRVRPRRWPYQAQGG